MSIRLAPTLLALILPSQVFFSNAAHAQQITSEYQDCANQTGGLPLTSCGKLFIDKGNKEIRIGHFLEGFKIYSDEKMYSLESKTLPIAIPKTNYDGQKSWIWNNRKYVKLAIGRTIFPQNDPGDVVAIISDIDKMKEGDAADDPNDYYLIKNTKVIFLYSKTKGVLAIALEDSGDSASVYLRISDHCLFDSRHKEAEEQ